MTHAYVLFSIGVKKDRVYVTLPYVKISVQDVYDPDEGRLVVRA